MVAVGGEGTFLPSHDERLVNTKCFFLPLVMFLVLRPGKKEGMVVVVVWLMEKHRSGIFSFILFFKFARPLFLYKLTIHLLLHKWRLIMRTFMSFISKVLMIMNQPPFVILPYPRPRYHTLAALIIRTHMCPGGK